MFSPDYPATMAGHMFPADPRAGRKGLLCRAEPADDVIDFERQFARRSIGLQNIAVRTEFTGFFNLFVFVEVAEDDNRRLRKLFRFEVA